MRDEGWALCKVIFLLFLYFNFNDNDQGHLVYSDFGFCCMTHNDNAINQNLVLS
jgi:hypothetical protein